MKIETDLPPLTVTPIGTIRTGMANKFDAPHQPDRAAAAESVIELLPHHDFDKALEDLAGFDHIWILFWFHRNSTWNPKVRPPRGEGKKRGVFATRSPHRPNPIGMTAVPLLEISGRQITIGSCDLVDGTPILDIKPYLPTADSFPDSRIGWLQDIEESFSGPPRFKVSLSELAETQAVWLKENGVHFIDRAITLLQRDPSINRTRRITKHRENVFRMGCAEWRVFFTVEGERVKIEYLQPGYPLQRLQDPGSAVIPNRNSQLSFAAIWPAPDDSLRNLLEGSLGE